MTIKTCDRCTSYTPSTTPGYENKGDCALMGDGNDGPNAADMAVGWDYEGYSAGVYVGPKFGCIHWVKKPKP